MIKLIGWNEMEYNIDVFNELKEKLSKYKTYYAKKKRILNTVETFTFNTSFYKEELPWSKAILRKYENHLQFDAFWGETEDYSYSKFFYENGFERKVNSLIKNSLLTGVSFACIMPSDDNFKIWTRSSGEMTFILEDAIPVLFISEYNDSEYIIFDKNSTFVVDDNGEFLRTIEVHNQGKPKVVIFELLPDEISQKPGVSIFPNEYIFSAKEAAKKSVMLREATKAQSEKNLLIATGINPSYLDAKTKKTTKTVEDDKVAGLGAIFSPNQAGEISKVSLDVASVSEISESVLASASHAASSAGVPLSVLGYSREGGSTIKDFNTLVERMQKSLGESIKELILITYFLKYKRSFKEGKGMVSGWVPIVDTEEIPALGDGLIKMSQAGIHITKKRVYEILGQSLRDEIFLKQNVMTMKEEINNNNINSNDIDIDDNSSSNNE